MSVFLFFRFHYFDQSYDDRENIKTHRCTRWEIWGNSTFCAWNNSINIILIFLPHNLLESNLFRQKLHGNNVKCWLEVHIFYSFHRIWIKTFLLSSQCRKDFKFILVEFLKNSLTHTLFLYHKQKTSCPFRFEWKSSL